MNKLLPLLACAALLAGCSNDASNNPWSTEQDRANADAEKANTAGTQENAIKPSSAEADPLKYSWQKKAAAAKAGQPAPELASGRAIITAMRGDAGLIQIKRTDASNPGDKLVLTKDNKSLQVVVSKVDGEAVIADISPRQIKTPALAIGDEVSCTVAVEPAPEAPAAPAAPAPAAQ